MTRRGSSPVFVGRRRELDRLEDAYARAVARRPSLVLVAGEAGVGKSRLAAEFDAVVDASGGRTITGACLDLGEGGLPYAPFVEGLRALARSIDVDRHIEMSGVSAGALNAVVPGLLPGGAAVADDRSDPLERRVRLFDAIIGFLGQVSQERPLVLTIEDIHWADGSTRDLIRFLVRNLQTERVLLVATIRTDDLHRRHPLMPLLSELERADRVERVDLRAFDRDELAAQLEGILGTTPTADVVDALLDRSDGLPFYVEELVSSDRDGGDASVIPATLRDILGLRLTALSSSAGALVGAASVIGGRFELDRLRATAGLGDDALVSGLREAVDARILVPGAGDRGSGYTFRHALLREAAYDELLPDERVRLHSSLADHLAARIAADSTPDPADIADFAIHADLAGDQARALEGAVQALQAFITVTAFREALVHAERALELWPRVADPETRTEMRHADLLETSARVAADAGMAKRSMALFQAAIAEVPVDAGGERLITLLADLWTVAWESYEFDVAFDVTARLSTMADDLPPSSLKARIHVQMGSDQWSRGLNRESLEPYQTAMSIAREVGADREWVTAAAALAHAYADIGRAGRGEAIADEVAKMLPWFDGTVWSFWAVADIEMAWWTAGRFEDSLRIANEGIEAARRHGLDGRVEPWLAPVDALFELGRFDGVEQVGRIARDSGVAGHPNLGDGLVVAKARIIRGRLDDARTAFAQRAPDNAIARSWDLDALLLLERAAGRFDTMSAYVDEARAIAATGECDGVTWMILSTAIWGAADEAVRLRGRRRRDEIKTVARLADQWYAHMRAIVEAGRGDGGAGAFCEAAFATATAELSRLDDASRPDLWADAIERWDRLGHRERGAYTRLRFAEATLDAGRDGTGSDRAAAITALTAARDMAVEMQASPLLADIAVLASRSRIDVDGVPVDAAVGASDRAESGTTLTARERDVLRLVAAGHTNREIGDQLFISEKTVSVHVSNAMAKLGALSRYEAAAAAEKQGLL